MKACTGPCGLRKPLAEFHRDKTRSDGRASRCKACFNAHKRSRYIPCPRKRLDRSTTSKTCADCGETKLLTEFAKKSATRYRSRCLLCFRTRNRTRYRDANDRRRALQASVTVEHFSRDELFAHWDELGLYACVYCDKPWEHVDHIQPLARGGSHSIGNLQPVCAEHNLSKSARDPLEFAASVVGQHVVDWVMGRAQTTS